MQCTRIVNMNILWCMAYGRWLCDCVSSFAYLKYSSTIYPISQVIIVYINYYSVTESCIVRLYERQKHVGESDARRKCTRVMQTCILHSRMDVEQRQLHCFDSTRLTMRTIGVQSVCPHIHSECTTQMAHK